MSTKQRFGINAATLQGEGLTEDANTLPVAAPPAASRARIDADMERQLSEVSAQAFPNSLSREPDVASSTPVVPPVQENAPATAPVPPPVYQPRNRNQREAAETVFIRAPKSLADRFHAIMEEENLAAKWDVLALLIETYDSQKRS